MDTWLVNGELASVVPASDRGLAYGAGLFETVALRQGRPRFLEFHLQRLADGCGRLGIRMPAEDLLLSEVRIAAGGQISGTVKIMVT